MLKFNTSIFGANLGRLSVDPIQAELTPPPAPPEPSDTFEYSSCCDTSITAMRDLARQSRQTVETADEGGKEVKKKSKVDLKHMTQAEKYDYYKGLIEDNGGKFRSKPGRRNLLSLLHDTNTKANHNQGRYDDTTVMLWTDKNGGKHVRRYRSNTEPSGQYQGRYGVDRDGDGRLDQCRMKGGYNEYYVSSSDHLGRVLRPSHATRSEVDVNHDGRFTKADGKHRTISGDYSMLFHAGGESNTGSAGCQTMPPEVFDRFWRDLTRGGKQGRIGYTIVDA